MRILVTGSRDWDDYDIVRTALAVAVYQNLPAVIVHGACPSGADAIASWWVRQIGRNLDITEEPHPAAWSKHDDGCPDWHRGQRVCRRAGHRRNAEMVALGAEVVCAFYKLGAANKGTANCVQLAGRAGIEIRRWSA